MRRNYEAGYGIIVIYNRKKFLLNTNVLTSNDS